jgi:hypothetical protein
VRVHRVTAPVWARLAWAVDTPSGGPGEAEAGWPNRMPSLGEDLMSEKTSGGPEGPGSGAAKPVTEPPGGALDRVLNEELADPDDEDESSEDKAER